MNVTAFRTGHSNSSVTTISANEFLGKCTDLPAVLEQVSGVAIRRTGGFGEYTDASIRGGSPKQVQVYLDGIPLNSAAGGAVDLSKIPLTALRDITVYKGTAPLELLGSTAGAVINLRSGAVKDMVAGLLELGSFGYRKAGTVLRKRIGPMTHYFSVDYSGARNDYPYEDDNDTPYNSDDDAIKTKNHNEFSMIGVNYSTNWQIRNDHRLTALVTFTDEFQELFHKQLVDTTQLASHSSESVLGRIDWEYSPAEYSIVETRFEGRYKRALFDDPLGHVYLSGARKERNTFPFAAVQCRTSGKIHDVIGLQMLVRGGCEGYSTVNLFAPSSASSSPAALRLTGGAAGECSLASENAGCILRYNHVYVRDSANFTPNHGSGKSLPKIWKNHFPNGNLDAFLNVRDWLTIDAAFRYEFLPVTLSDRYGWGNNYLGNPRLLPERRSEGNIGCILRRDPVESSFAVFIGTTMDMIELQPQSQRILMAINSGNAFHTGLEWDLHSTPWPYLTIDNHLTVIRKKRLNEFSNGWSEKRLLFFSPVENDFRITFSHDRFSLGHSLHYRSPFYKNYTLATDLVAPAPACNVSLSVNPVRHVTLTYRLENYLNVRYAPLSYYTPLPGRMHFFIGKIQW
ncbi:MAG: TonB-dependent receptor plug domain-containing protein [Chitinispirillaceae bacterium]|nr:TonB-dependent receptor plug domain-containing protein [Chitinispirillaceae bacterium]